MPQGSLGLRDQPPSDPGTGRDDPPLARFSLSLVQKRISMIELHDGPDSTIVCRPSGDLDFPDSLTFRQVIVDLLHPGLRIVIDLRNAHNVDAVGLNTLLSTARRVLSVGGTARIANADPRLRCLLRSVGADPFIEPPWATSPPDAA